MNKRMTLIEEEAQILACKDATTSFAVVDPFTRVDKWSGGQSGTGNMLIHGDNLQVMVSSLAKHYSDDLVRVRFTLGSAL